MEKVEKKWMVTFNPSYNCMNAFLDISTKNINEAIKSMFLDYPMGYIINRDNKYKYLVSGPCFYKYFFLMRSFIADVMGSIPINAIELNDDELTELNDNELRKSNVYIYKNTIIANYYWITIGDFLSEKSKAKYIAKKLNELDFNNCVIK